MAMAPALTETAGQAQKLRLPYAPPVTTSSSTLNGGQSTPNGFKEESDGEEPDTGGKLVDPDTFTGQGRRSNGVTRLYYAKRCPAAAPHLHVGARLPAGAVGDYGIDWTVRLGADRVNGKGTMNERYKASSDNGRVPGRGIMGLLKTNTGLIMDGSSSPGVDAAESSDPSVTHTNSTEPQTRLRQGLSQGTDQCLTAAQVTWADSRQISRDVATLEKIQANLRRRTERTLRRFHLLKTLQMAEHVGRQLVNFVGHQRKALQMPMKTNRTMGHLCRGKPTQSSSSSSSSSSSNGGCSGLKVEFLQSEDVKNMSTAALVNLVRKLESGDGSNATLKQHQRLDSFVPKCGALAIGGGSGNSASTRTQVDPLQGATKLDRNVCQGMEWTTGTLLTNLEHLEKEVDSDATASSSGGESCDEMMEVEEKKSRAVPLYKRARWKWAVDRAAIISRWTWLQAQVSDLEYRIHQTSEICRQIRTAKGPVIGEKMVPQPGTSAQVNGYVPGLSTSSCDNAPLPEGSCSRTCPLRPIKRRKLLPILGLHQTNQKVAKLSWVKCTCSPPTRSCATCCGRINYMLPIDPERMSVNERVCLLDPSFHPVLSFPQDTPLAVHFEALLRHGEHGKFCAKARPGTSMKKKSRVSSQMNEHARKQCRKLKKNATATLTAKLRKKLTKQKRVPGRQKRTSGHLSKKRTGSRGSLPLSEDHCERSVSESSYLSSKAESPVPSPGFIENSSSQASGNSNWGSGDIKDQLKKGGILHEMMRRRRGESAFDINNIVIPYSMAAATRVERLQYKEILTPKWRIIDEMLPDLDTSVPASVPGAPEEDEDVSEEAVIHRHERCEHQERKRFMGYVHHPNMGRRTRSMRSDSRADSSGANTPDPMSPHNVEPHESPLTTPPSTPAPPIEEGSQHITVRRRTTSLSKRDRMLDDLRIPTPDFMEEINFLQPWDTRVFPLLDWEYEQMVQESSTWEESSSPVDVNCPILGDTSVDSTQWNGGPGISDITIRPDTDSVAPIENSEWIPPLSSSEDKGSIHGVKLAKT